ncbi:tyrosine-protein phosphatase [Levilactobacillus fujinensis]|uniref:Tyrosine-protein phosphatase n=1 Tax=Levilactobacillus fujinensis TaxID=2486024 RepID=A0ABW1TJA5_9LACO|nr:tyrosine-protein phosphatase [Levilactobacillus fujinensis]
MTHHLKRTLSLSLLTMTLLGMGTPVVTSLAATVPTAQLAANGVNSGDPDLAPLMNGEQMPATMATPTVPATGQPGSRLALSKDKKGYNANTRDLGGYLTQDKTKMIKPGTLFRSAQLTKLSPADVLKLKAYKFGLLIDLRTAEAHLTKVDANIGQTRSKDDSIYSQADDDNFSGVEHYNRANGGSIAFSATALSGYHAFLTDLLSAQGPVLYHCKHGNDRTGIATVILMSILGMRNQDIISDYLMSNNYVDKQVDYAWLKTYFSQIDEKFGSMKNYIASKDGLNFDSTQQSALKAKYLVSSGMTKPTEKPSTPNVVNPAQPKPVTPKPQIPATPSKPEVATKPTLQPVATNQQPDTTATQPKPQKSRRTKVKIVSVKKLKHAKFVHLKAHRAYFFDLHLKHKVGKTGKTGLHPKAKWKILKQAKISVNGKIKTYVAVQSPHGKTRWTQLKDVTLLKPTTHHTH